MSEEDKKTLENYKKLLVKFKEVYKPRERKLDFFNVAGYPHYENVVSNILQFFFDTDEEHGLGNLWIRSLVECYQDNYKEKFEEEKADQLYTKTIYREYGTEEKKRIDILIETKNNLVISIENKIYSDVHNPFDEYHKTAHDFGCNIMEILLTVKEEDNKIDETKDYHYINILYEKLLEKIRKNLGEYIENANEKWLIYMNEFMRNLEARGSMGNIKFDKDFQVFLSQNKDLKNLLEAIKDDEKNKTTFLETACGNINGSIREGELSGKVSEGKGVTKSDRQSFYFDIRMKDKTLVYEPFFKKIASGEDCGKLFLAVWERDKMELPKEKIKGKFPEAGFEIINNWGETATIETLDFADVTVDRFAEKSMDILKKLVEIEE